jgi:hypothetical protein
MLLPAVRRKFEETQAVGEPLTGSGVLSREVYVFQVKLEEKKKNNQVAWWNYLPT